MADYSQLSDQDLDNLILQKSKSQPSPYANMSDDELDRAILQKTNQVPQQQPQSKGFLHSLVNAVTNPTQAAQDLAKGAYGVGQDIKEGLTKEGAGSAALSGYGQGVSSGYLPQLQAMAQPLTDRAFNAIGKTYNAAVAGPLGLQKDPTLSDEQLAPWAQMNPNSPEYVKARDAANATIQQQKAEHPGVFTTGQIAGGLNQALAVPIPGAKAVQGLTGMKGLAAKGLLATATGGAQGFLQNPGDAPGVVDPLQWNERKENAETGAKTAAATFGATEATKGVLNKLANIQPALEKTAQTQAVRSAGAMLKDYRQMAPKGEVEKIGQFMLDNGLVGAGDSFEKVADKASKFNNEAGTRLSDIYSQAQKAIEENPQTLENMTAEQIEAFHNTGFNPVRDKDTILSLVKKGLGDAEGAKATVNRMDTYLDELGQKYGNETLDPKTAQNIKTAVDKEINYARNPLTKEPKAENAFKTIRQFIAKRIDDHVDLLGQVSGNPDLAEKLSQANKDYGYSKSVMRMAEDKVNRETANRMFGLTDNIIGGAGAVAGGVAGMAMGHDAEHAAKGAGIGFLAGMANKAARKYGPSTLASGANLASKGAGLISVPAEGVNAMIPNSLNTSRALTPVLVDKKKGLINQGTR